MTTEDKLNELRIKKLNAEAGDAAQQAGQLKNLAGDIYERLARPSGYDWNNKNMVREYLRRSRKLIDTLEEYING